MNHELTRTISYLELFWCVVVVLSIIGNLCFFRMSYKKLRLVNELDEPKSIRLAALGLLLRDVIRLLSQFAFTIPGYIAITTMNAPIHGWRSWGFVGALVFVEVAITVNAYVDAFLNNRIVEQRKREERGKRVAHGC